MTKSLRIHLLGPFEISLNGESLTKKEWRSQQTQTIAKILMANNGKVITSDFLREVLWPNDPVESTQSRLHVRVSQLRNGLKGKKELLRTVNGGYVFEADDSCWMDVLEFQSLISKGESYQEIGQQQQAIRVYEEACKLYRGDFLAEDLYADWTYLKREFFRERFLTLLIELSECYAQQGRYRLAVARARQALDQDHLRETIYVRLMLYHYYGGDRAQALRTFEHCREVLGSELNVPPMQSTLQLAAQIKRGTLWEKSDVPHYPPPIYEGRLFEVPYALTEIPFEGRDREYAWLVSQWKDPEKSVIFIEGEAGIGKSRLLEIFTGYLNSQGARILQTRLSPSERTPLAVLNIFKPILTNKILNKLTPATLAVLSSPFPQLRKQFEPLPQVPHLNPSAERQRFYQAIADLAAAAEDKPTLLIIDDAHRLTKESLELLKYLSQSFSILLSCRSEDTPPDHPIRNTFGESGLRLSPLTDDVVHSIIQGLSGQENKVIASKICTQSEGNPLFIVSLLGHMFETGQLYLDSSGKWSLTDQVSTTLPVNLRTTIETRLGHLNRVQRRILDFAAVMGGEFSFDLMRTASRQSEDILLGILDELIDTALVAEPRRLDKPEFIITHDRYTEIAYETIPPVRRKAMHLSVAKAIEQNHTERLDSYFPALADHYDSANVLEKAAHYAGLAGEQAAAHFAITEALHYLSRALELLSKDDIITRARLCLIQEKVYDLQGNRQAQKEDLAVLETYSSKLSIRQQAEICLRRGAYEWIIGNAEDANAIIADAIEKAKSCHAQDLQAKGLYLAGQAAENFDESKKHFKQARELAKITGQHALEGDIVRWQGNVAFWQNRYSDCLAFFEEALKIHREVGDLRGELSVLNNLGHVLEKTSQPSIASEQYEQALQICQKIQDRLGEGVILTNLGYLNLQMGDFQPAQTHLERALVIRDEIGNEEGSAVVHANLGDLHKQLGKYGKALAHYRAALDINQRIEHKRQTAETLTALAALYREMGDYELSYEHLDEAALILPPKDFLPTHIQLSVESSALNYQCGDHLKSLITLEETLPRSEVLPSLSAAVLKNLGHVLASLKRWDESKDNYLKSIGIYKKQGQSHLAAEPMAGLAKIALLRKDNNQAISFTSQILDMMNGKGLYGPDRLLWIYLTCYQVLSIVQDPRASEMIEKVHTLLVQRADSIPDESLRISFLENIQENKQISEIWETQIKNH